jgi:pimeloyl-ACP methyl ester carboxylesterase
MNQGVLPVAGARLYYEIHGSGPLLLMIPGANGTAESFRRVTEYLAGSYTVVLYDRRGFSRSGLEGAQDYDRRLETEADDVRRLIEHLGGEPAVVFGTSSGAIVALEVLGRHPSVVRAVVPFEPPVVRLLPDGQKWVDFFFDVYAIYRRSGPGPALDRFRTETFATADRHAMAGAMDFSRNDHALANARYWFEHELRQYPSIALDLDSLTTHADRMVLTVGRESRGYPAREATEELGKRLGRQVVELPGGHVGGMTRPVDFAAELVRVLTCS